jgi:hypothetical protein
LPYTFRNRNFSWQNIRNWSLEGFYFRQYFSLWVTPVFFIFRALIFFVYWLTYAQILHSNGGKDFGGFRDYWEIYVLFFVEGIILGRLYPLVGPIFLSWGFFRYDPEKVKILGNNLRKIFEDPS